MTLPVIILWLYIVLTSSIDTLVAFSICVYRNCDVKICFAPLTRLYVGSRTAGMRLRWRPSRTSCKLQNDGCKYFYRRCGGSTGTSHRLAVPRTRLIGRSEARGRSRISGRLIYWKLENWSRQLCGERIFTVNTPKRAVKTTKKKRGVEQQLRLFSLKVKRASLEKDFSLLPLIAHAVCWKKKKKSTLLKASLFLPTENFAFATTRWRNDNSFTVQVPLISENPCLKYYLKPISCKVKCHGSRNCFIQVFFFDTQCGTRDFLTGSPLMSLTLDNEVDDDVALLCYCKH